MDLLQSELCSSYMKLSTKLTNSTFNLKGRRLISPTWKCRSKQRKDSSMISLYPIPIGFLTRSISSQTDLETAKSSNKDSIVVRLSSQYKLYIWPSWTVDYLFFQTLFWQIGRHDPAVGAAKKLRVWREVFDKGSVFSCHWWE